jgi:acetyl esterase/lipase
MTLSFDEQELAAARRVNALLAWAPRARIRSRLEYIVLQRSLAAAEALSTWRLRRSGLVVENRRVAALGRSAEVRIIRPPTDCRAVYLEMHGGGWAFGTAALDDRLNAEVVRGCQFATVSVEYRRVPQHPLSAVIEDCETVAAWLIENAQREFGTSTVFIGGESAGAHLAACTALRARHFGEIAGAVLFYGIYDLSGSASLRRAGRDTLFLHGPTLAPSLDRLIAFNKIVDPRDPSISPLFADLENLPPALFVVGTSDPLIDDTVSMAERWRDASGNVEFVVVPDAPHAFNRLPTRLAAKTNAYAREWLTKRVSAPAHASLPANERAASLVPA